MLIEHGLSPHIVYGFAAVVLLHGALHLLGAASGFRLVDLGELETPISPVMGGFWAVAALALLGTGVSYLASVSLWWVAGLLAVVVSQVLVVLHWRDAWGGTVANAILAVGCLLGYGATQFNTMIESDWRAMRTDRKPAAEPVEADDLETLPEPVARWLQMSDVVGKRPPTEVRLGQVGEMRTEPEGAWMPVEAEQAVGVHPPRFLWTASVRMGRFVYLSARDRYIDGESSMRIDVYSLVPVVDASGRKIDQGALVRFLAESIWYPSAALADYVEWQPVDDATARATITYGGIEATGLFQFNDEGEVVGFAADRYFHRPDGATKERWRVDVDPGSYETRDGVRVPTEAVVSWKFDQVFPWYRVEIDEYSRQTRHGGGDDGG